MSIQRTLLASDHANAAAIRAVTEILLERRQEIMDEIPAKMTEVRLLLVQTRRPQPQSGLGPALHPGALSFYDKDKPSFLLAHADYVGLILTVGLMAGSWIWELKRWMQRQQKIERGSIQQPRGGTDQRSARGDFAGASGRNLA